MYLVSSIIYSKIVKDRRRNSKVASVSEETSAGIEETTASVQEETNSIEIVFQNALKVSELSDNLSNMVKKF